MKRLNDVVYKIQMIIHCEMQVLRLIDDVFKIQMIIQCEMEVLHVYPLAPYKSQPFSSVRGDPI